jgi:hypothetical protein
MARKKPVTFPTVTNTADRIKIDLAYRYIGGDPAVSAVVIARTK